jgi:hypothetical protein
MIGFVLSDSYKPGFFLGLLLVSGIYFGIDKEVKETEYVSTKTTIYSLKDAGSNVSGSFFLGSGIVQSEPIYSMFIESEGNSKKKYFVGADALIFEGEQDNNYHEEIKCVVGGYYSFLMGARVKKDDCKFKVKNKLYVPKGTITNNFSI